MTLPLRRWADRFDAGAIEVRSADGVARVVLGPERAALDGLAATLDRASDPELRARLGTTAGLVVKLVPGWVHVELAAGSVLEVEAGGSGAPGAVVLARPMRVRMEGAMLLRAAGMALALSEASLAPDGRVELVPAGRAGARRLALASRVLTGVARRRPQVRRYLAPG